LEKVFSLLCIVMSWYVLLDHFVCVGSKFHIIDIQLEAVAAVDRP